MATENKLPLKSISLLTALNILTAFVGLLQTIAIAWFFGSTRTVEIFFAAITFQMFLQQLTSSGQIGDLFTPIYHRISADHGLEAARRAFAAMTNVMIGFATIIASLAALLAQPVTEILVPGFSAEDQALSARVFLVVTPVIILQIAYAMYSNLLRADHRYGVSESLSLVSRIANLVILLCFAKTLGIWALIAGLWISAVIGLAGQCWFVHRNGPRHRLILATEHFHPREVLFKLPLAFTHIAAGQFFALALTAGLSMLPEGSFAAYTYAKRLHSKFQGIVLQPIGVVFFNHFSDSLAKGADRVRSYAEHALGLTIATIAFCCVPIAAGGDLLLAGLWGSETFPPERIQQSYWILCALTTMLIFNAQYLIARRTNLALKVVGKQFAASGCVLAIGGVLCYWVIPAYGLAGAVLVQAITAVGTAAVTLVVLAATRRDLVCLLPIRSLTQWSVAAVSSIGLVWFVREQVLSEEFLLGSRPLLAGMVTCVASIVCLLAISLLLQIPETHELIHKARQQIRRLSGPGVQA